MAQTEEIMFQNLDYNPTVFKTGLEEIRNETKSWEGPWRPEGDLMRFLQTHYVPTYTKMIFCYQNSSDLL